MTVNPISAVRHEAFVRGQRSVGFQQVPSWGGVKTAWRSESVGWFEGRELVGVGLVLYRPVPRFDRRALAYVPWGPVIDWTGDIGASIDPLAAHVRAEGAFALRVAPPVRTHLWRSSRVKEGLADHQVMRLLDVASDATNPVGSHVESWLRDAGWLPQSATDGFGAGQPQYTFELPLLGADDTPQTDSALLGGMNQQWRRNIKRSDKEGVEVTTSTGSDNVRAFHDLYVETAERDHLVPRPLRYFETLLAELNADESGVATLYLARHDGNLVAAAIGIRIGAHAWYVYGASSNDSREVRGSNACQWAMIRDARDAGGDVYDMRGITPTVDEADPHVGLIRFKVGTGGHAVRYVGEWDLPLRPPAYRAFRLYMQYRDRVRGARS